MRPTMLGVAALAVVAAACVNVSPETSTSPLHSVAIPTIPPLPTIRPLPTIPVEPSATPLPSTATLAPATSIAPATPTGVPTLTATIGSGPSQHTFSVSGEPNCSHGVIGDDTWAVAWGDISAGDGQLSQVQVTDEPDKSAKNARIVSAYIVVGPVFGGTGYTLSFDRFGAKFTREVQDDGETATIHIAGKTTASMLGAGGVPIDLTVSCPTVNRG